MLSVYEITKKNQKQKAITRIKWEKNQKQMQTGHSVKSRNGQQDEQCWEDAQCSQEKHSCNAPFSSVFCYSFLWSLICNAEFDLNSLCLDRLNKFGIISSQKLQNLPQNAISSTIGTRTCQLG